MIGYAVDGQILRLGDHLDEDVFKKDQNGIGNVIVLNNYKVVGGIRCVTY